MPSKAEKKRRQQRKVEKGQKSSNDDLSSSSEEFPFVPKPEVPGNLGTEISLISNNYRIQFNIKHLYHYDVTITPLYPWRPKKEPTSTEARENLPVEDVEKVSEPGKAIRGKYRCMNTKTNRKVMEKFVEEQREMFSKNNYAFDGVRNMYTLNELQTNKNEYTVKIIDDMNREAQYEIRIQSSVSKSGSSRVILQSLKSLLEVQSHTIPQDAVMALETVLKHEPAKTHVPVGRSFFPDYTERFNLPGGRLMKFGYQQSVLLTKGTALLNIDMTATTFYQPGPVIMFLTHLLKMMQKERKLKQGITIENVMQFPDEANRLFERFKKEIIGTRVGVSHLENSRKYIVYDVTNEPANNLYFDLEEEQRRFSVAEYFFEKYKMKLPNSHLPCLQVHKERSIYMPLDVCKFPEGEHCRCKVGSLQTSEMIKKSALSPVDRFKFIQQTVDQSTTDFGDHRNAFGITIGNSPVRLTGRILNPPKMIYRSRTVKPIFGEWKLGDKKFLEGTSIKYWSILCLCRDEEIGFHLEEFRRKFHEVGEKVGLCISPVSDVAYWENDDTDPCDLLRDLCDENEMLQLIVVVLRSKNSDEYTKIKYCAETELGIATQCITSENLCKSNNFVSENLLQKINGKLGGDNTCIDSSEIPSFLNDSVMIIGADCNHPSPHDGVNYSVAAAVGSIDANMFQYANAWKLQPKVDNKRVEIIQHLTEMVKNLLKAYREERGKLPSKIIFFRDGVSEGEYKKALDEEIPQVFEACDAYHYRPALTFIIVTKRHHTKFRVVNDTEVGGNLPPGTVVTTDVTHVLNFDYYLCSQKGLKGTSIPAHYTVIYDDNNFRANPDSLYKFSYCLCHVSARCTKSISIPVPVKYADLLAYRIKQYLIAKREETQDFSNISTEDLERDVSVSEKLSDNMFYI